MKRLLVLAVLLLAACSRQTVYRPQAQGDADNGRRHLIRYECGACHTIAGVRSARGQVGPALRDYARNVYVAGKFPNTPEFLTAWILDPPSLAPLTAMPKVGVTPDEAADIAAYLYSN